MINRPPVDGGDELVTPLNVVVGDRPEAVADGNDAAAGSQQAGRCRTGLAPGSDQPPTPIPGMADKALPGLPVAPAGTPGAGCPSAVSSAASGGHGASASAYRLVSGCGAEAFQPA